MNDIIVNALGLGVELNGLRIVDGVSLSATYGQTVAVVGPNGSGKTTLLRALAGLIPSSGDLTVAGLDPRTAPPADCARRRVYCAQKPASAWDYRVCDLGEIVGEPNGFADWLEKLNLSDCTARQLSSLSGGEQKSAHLAMAFASLLEPFGGVLLLDEPTAALDLNRQEATWSAVHDFNQAGATCIVATHDLNFARRCNLVVVLYEGRLAAIGKPGEVLVAEIISSVWGDFASSLR